MSDTIRVEEVEAVSPPPRARVEDAAGEPRQRDYLSGFLQQQPAGDAAHEPGGALYESVIDALKEIYDPEIPVNIYDLGLIYGVEVGDDNHVVVNMTLTSPGCPAGPELTSAVWMTVKRMEGVKDCDVKLIWSPRWDPQVHASEEGRMVLGLW